MTTVIFVLIFVIFFQFGVGPIPPFITSELFVTAQRYLRNPPFIQNFFHQQICRPQACSITALVNWISNMIIGAVYPLVSQAIGGLSFLIFGAIILISVIYVTLCVPETKGKTIR